MKRKKAALYDPYLDVLGGGERYILSILQELEETGYDPHIFWDIDLTESIRTQLNIKFSSSIKFYPNIFRKKHGFFKKLSELKSFDIFLYVTDGSYFYSTAKKNYIYCMVPQKKLYPSNFATKIKTSNAQFITHSYFVQDFLKRWGIDSQVLYPFLDSVFTDIPATSLKKEKIIISVGRFFQHLHNKKHDVTIELYKKLKQKSKLFKDYKLIIAGGLKKEDTDYFNKLKDLAHDDSSISLIPNISHTELIDLYKRATIYWHMAGYGVDENKHPDQVEHLGITPLEAMAASCITICYNAGGSKELIVDGKNGFLFQNEDELFEKVIAVAEDPEQQKTIKKNAKEFISEHFTKSVFKEHVKKIIV